MRATGALLALLLLGATAPADLPSFACTGKLNAAEQAICADPELAAWDRANALFYPIQRKHGSITAAQQRNWLAERDRCGSVKTCLRRAFQNWVGFPAPTGFGTEFERPAKYDSAGLEITTIGAGWYAFSANAIHVVFDNRGKFLTANEGNVDGVVLVNNGRGHYSSDPGDEFSCEIDFARQRAGWRLEDNGQCGGRGVTLSGRYVADRKTKR